MSQYLVAVTIPIYKEDISTEEQISLNQCINVLGNHPIIFFAPEGLNAAIYEKICQDRITFQIKYFERYFFENIAGYNQLMLSANFYKTFLNFRFILIYQLDAFVFKDRLAYWCYQNYDYIGAPIAPHENHDGEIQFLKGYSKFLQMLNRIFRRNYKVSNVGNGGFSLRKTKTCYWLVNIFQSKVSAWGKNNEDGFFRYWGNILRPIFKLPEDKTARHFSIEPVTGECFESFTDDTHFGCHAFEKFESKTWDSYLNGI